MALSRLPTELIEHITTYLDLPDSRSLRLTSPSLSRQTSHVFKDRFFRQHTLQWTEAAFIRLLEITSHPHFGNAIQDLIVDATPRHSIHLWQAQIRIAETQGIATPYGTASATRDLEIQYIADYTVSEEIAKFFSETRFDRKSLVTVLERLEHLDSITFAYEGMHEKYAKFCTRYCKSSQQEMSRPFVSTMSAIAESKVQVRRIQVDSDKAFGAVSIGKLETLAPSLRYFDHAFEKLDTLQLHLRDLRSSVSGFEIDTIRAPFVVRFLAKARNVRKLELSCYSILEMDVFGEMARHCQFEKLEECKLSVMRIMNGDDLLTLLQPAENTLRSLSMRYIMNSDPYNTWWHILSRVAKEEDVLPRLNHLHLGCLISDSRRRVWMNELQVQSFAGNDWRGHLSDALDQYKTKAADSSWSLGALAYPFVGLSV